MAKFTRADIPAILGLALLSATPAAHAGVIVENLQFVTTGQDMWAPGAPVTLTKEIFLGERWGTYRQRGDDLLYDLTVGTYPSAADDYSFGGFTGGVSRNVCVGVNTYWGCAGFRADIDTTTGLEATLETSGQVGIYAGTKLSGGGLDITVPIQARLELPDRVTAGEFFRVSTSATTQSVGGIITAKAPTAEMYIDGVFDIRNHFFGAACALGNCVNGATDFDITAGRFPILGFKTQDNPLSLFGLEVPGIPFESVAKYTWRAPSPTQPICIEHTGGGELFPCFPKPAELGDISLTALANKSGGIVAENHLTMVTNQNVLSANLSLTGALEALFPIIPGAGVLKNSLTVVDGPGALDLKLGYTIVDVRVGPFLGLQQAFDLNPKPAVRLQFDQPVVRIETVVVGTQLGQVGTTTVCDISFFGFCISSHEEPVFGQVPVYGPGLVTHADGLIEMLLGEQADLMFEDGIGQLLTQEYFLHNPVFSNNTSLTIGVGGNLKAGCLAIPGLVNGCVIDEGIQTSTPFLSVFDRSWTIGGFGTVAGTAVYRFNDPSLPPVSVPEPQTLTLLLLGLLAIPFSARGRALFAGPTPRP